MTKTEATRAVKKQLRAAGLGNYKVRSETCCGPGVLTSVAGEPELLREALNSLPGVAKLHELSLSVVVQWEVAS